MLLTDCSGVQRTRGGVKIDKDVLDNILHKNKTNESSKQRAEKQGIWTDSKQLIYREDSEKNIQNLIQV